MSNLQSFDDRFIYSNPALDGVDVNTLSDTQLEALSPGLKEFAQEVRRHSVLLKRKTSVEIYNAVTLHADPRIALVLAAARDKQGVKLFPNLETVKALMFGPASEAGTEYLDSDLNIFVQGIRRVAAALSASLLIGQLAQIPEQAQHSVVLEKEALSDLDRILSVPDIVEATTKQLAQSTASEEYSFYFEVLDMILDSSLQVEVFLSGTTGSQWNIVNTYSGNCSTALIVGDIADTINSLTLVSNSTNLIASPVLFGRNNLHSIKLNARFRDAEISTEVIIIRFKNLKNGTSVALPFKWGVDINFLAYGSINSLLVAVQQGKATTASTTRLVTGSPTVLYFRRKVVNNTNDVLDYDGSIIPSSIWANSSLEYRISPTVSTTTTLAVPRLIDVDPATQVKLDQERAAQVALILLNSLFETKGTTKCLAAIVRNDDPNDPNPLTGLELVAFSAINPQVWMVLDLLQLPPDIEVATGNLTGPLTSFSSKPRSIRVETHYEFRLAQTSTDGGLAGSTIVGGKPILTSLKGTLADRIKNKTRIYTAYSNQLIGYSNLSSVNQPEEYI